MSKTILILVYKYVKIGLMNETVNPDLLPVGLVLGAGLTPDRDSFLNANVAADLVVDGLISPSHLILTGNGNVGSTVEGELTESRYMASIIHERLQALDVRSPLCIMDSTATDTIDNVIFGLETAVEYDFSDLIIIGRRGHANRALSIARAHLAGMEHVANMRIAPTGEESFKGAVRETVCKRLYDAMTAGNTGAELAVAEQRYRVAVAYPKRVLHKVGLTNKY